MPVDFFKKELGRAQIRFNQTFGSMPLCNPKVRVRVIFAIVKMGILQQRIKDKKLKKDICEFVKIKDALNNIFSTLTQEAERRRHECYENEVEIVNDVNRKRLWDDDISKKTFYRGNPLKSGDFQRR